MNEGFSVNKRELGGKEEERVAEFLKGQGCSVLCRNYRCRSGEIDIIYSDSDGTICFGEVKFRNSIKNGLPEEAVNKKKQRVISRVSDHYRAKFELDESFSFRYDVIAVTPDEIRWIKDAFWYVSR